MRKDGQAIASRGARRASVTRREHQPCAPVAAQLVLGRTLRARSTMGKIRGCAQAVAYYLKLLQRGGISHPARPFSLWHQAKVTQGRAPRTPNSLKAIAFNTCPRRKGRLVVAHPMISQHEPLDIADSPPLSLVRIA